MTTYRFYCNECDIFLEEDADESDLVSHLESKHFDEALQNFWEWYSHSMLNEMVEANSTLFEEKEYCDHCEGECSHP